jgi:uncharacterized membrane protein
MVFELYLSITGIPLQDFSRSGSEKMAIDSEHLFDLEAAVSHWIHVVGTCIEIFGVFIIVAGIIWSTFLYLHRREEKWHYDQYKIRIGRSLLLGLELLVAADIIKTIAIELTFTSLGLLAGLVLVRTFLSWTLVLEIEGRWPWRRELLPKGHGA